MQNRETRIARIGTDGETRLSQMLTDDPGEGNEERRMMTAEERSTRSKVHVPGSERTKSWGEPFPRCPLSTPSTLNPRPSTSGIIEATDEHAPELKR